MASWWSFSQSYLCARKGRRVEKEGFKDQSEGIRRIMLAADVRNDRIKIAWDLKVTKARFFGVRRSKVPDRMNEWPSFQWLQSVPWCYFTGVQSFGHSDTHSGPLFFCYLPGSSSCSESDVMRPVGCVIRDDGSAFDPVHPAAADVWDQEDEMRIRRNHDLKETLKNCLPHPPLIRKVVVGESAADHHRYQHHDHLPSIIRSRNHEKKQILTLTLPLHTSYSRDVLERYWWWCSEDEFPGFYAFNVGPILWWMSSSNFYIPHSILPLFLFPIHEDHEDDTS